MHNIAKLVELRFNIMSLRLLVFFSRTRLNMYISLSGIESVITRASKPEKGLGGTKNKRACYTKGNKK